MKKLNSSIRQEILSGNVSWMLNRTKASPPVPNPLTRKYVWWMEELLIQFRKKERRNVGKKVLLSICLCVCHFTKCRNHITEAISPHHILNCFQQTNPAFWFWETSIQIQNYGCYDSLHSEFISEWVLNILDLGLHMYYIVLNLVCLLKCLLT